MPSKPTSRILQAARELRQNATKAEALLWDALRSHRLEGYKFRRQHPIGRFVLDFYCAKCHLAVEVDGTTHQEAEQRQNDVLRSQELKECGIRVLRVTNREVEEDMEGVLRRILEVMAEGTSPPAPSPK
jgi:very-short-patch-repair endonuclease